MKYLHIAALLAVASGCAVNNATANCAPADRGVTVCYEVDAEDHMAGSTISIRAERDKRSVNCDAADANVHGLQCDLDNVDNGSTWFFQFTLVPSDVGQSRRPLCVYTTEARCLGELNVFIDGEFVAGFADPPEDPFFYDTAQPLTRLGLW